MNRLIYTEDQIQTVVSLLDGITTTGIENARRIAVIVNELESGINEQVDEKEGEK